MGGSQMSLYTRSTVIDASLDAVWDFHSRIDGLITVTPDWLNLQIDAVVGPEGEPNPQLLEVDTRISLSIRPFGIGPRISWTSLITDRQTGDGTREFTDVMENGPFETWIHTHRFVERGDHTRLTDRVEYSFPFGPFQKLSGVAWPGFELMFRDRQRRTRAVFQQ